MPSKYTPVDHDRRTDRKLNIEQVCYVHDQVQTQGRSQYALARELGVSQPTISRIINPCTDTTPLSVKLNRLWR